MKESKKQLKEKNIIKAAKKVFNDVGFKNAKMEDIAAEAGITKVTLYTYFHSKENLYLAITYKSLQKLCDKYYESLDKYKNRNGLESVVALFDTFMSFCEDNFLYSEMILDYFSMMRLTSSGQDESKMTDATKESIYYLKMQDIQNLPLKLTAKEIVRGQEDGSILSHIDPFFGTLHGWTVVIGYTKLLNANGSDKSMMNVKLPDLKEFNLRLVKSLLSKQSMHDTLTAEELPSL